MKTLNANQPLLLHQLAQYAFVNSVSASGMALNKTTTKTGFRGLVTFSQEINTKRGIADVPLLRGVFVVDFNPGYVRPQRLLPPPIIALLLVCLCECVCVREYAVLCLRCGGF